MKMFNIWKGKRTENIKIKNIIKAMVLGNIGLSKRIYSRISRKKLAKMCPKLQII